MASFFERVVPILSLLTKHLIDGVKLADDLIAPLRQIGSGDWKMLQELMPEYVLGEGRLADKDILRLWLSDDGLLEGNIEIHLDTGHVAGWNPYTEGSGTQMAIYKDVIHTISSTDDISFVVDTTAKRSELHQDHRVYAEIVISQICRLRKEYDGKVWAHNEDHATYQPETPEDIYKLLVLLYGNGITTLLTYGNGKFTLHNVVSDVVSDVISDVVSDVTPTVDFVVSHSSGCVSVSTVQNDFDEVSRIITLLIKHCITGVVMSERLFRVITHDGTLERLKLSGVVGSHSKHADTSVVVHIYGPGSHHHFCLMYDRSFCLFFPGPVPPSRTQLRSTNGRFFHNVDSIHDVEWVVNTSNARQALNSEYVCCLGVLVTRIVRAEHEPYTINKTMWPHVPSWNVAKMYKDMRIEFGNSIGRILTLEGVTFTYTGCDQDTTRVKVDVQEHVVVVSLVKNENDLCNEQVCSTSDLPTEISSEMSSDPDYPSIVASILKKVHARVLPNNNAHHITFGNVVPLLNAPSFMKALAAELTDGVFRWSGSGDTDNSHHKYASGGKVSVFSFSCNGVETILYVRMYVTEEWEPLQHVFRRIYACLKTESLHKVKSYVSCTPLPQETIAKLSAGFPCEKDRLFALEDLWYIATNDNDHTITGVTVRSNTSVIFVVTDAAGCECDVELSRDTLAMDGGCLTVSPHIQPPVTESSTPSPPSTGYDQEREEYIRRFKILKNQYPQLLVPDDRENLTMQDLEAVYKRTVAELREDRETKEKIFMKKLFSSLIDAIAEKVVHRCDPLTDLLEVLIAEEDMSVIKKKVFECALRMHTSAPFGIGGAATTSTSSTPSTVSKERALVLKLVQQLGDGTSVEDMRMTAMVVILQ